MDIVTETTSVDEKFPVAALQNGMTVDLGSLWNGVGTLTRMFVRRRRGHGRFLPSPTASPSRILMNASKP